MAPELSDWLARFREDPEALERSLRAPVLWVEPNAPDDDAGDDEERSLHTASGVGPAPARPEPLLLLVTKHKQNAFQRGVTVGRTPNNDLVIDDGSVSRFHSWFQAGRDGEWALVDAGSKNGTFVSLRQLTARKPFGLQGGERLRFGHVDAWFLPPSKVVERLRRRAGR